MKGKSGPKPQPLNRAKAPADQAPKQNAPDAVPGDPKPIIGSLDGEAVDLQAETLAGDMRDAVLFEVRKLAAWQTAPEASQRAFNQAIEHKCQRVIEGVVRLVLQYDFPAVPVDLHKMNFDKVIDVRCSAVFEPDNVLSLSRQLHRRAVMLLVDPEMFFGEREPAKIDPDQTEAFAA